MSLSTYQSYWGKRARGSFFSDFSIIPKQFPYGKVPRAKQKSWKCCPLGKRGTLFAAKSLKWGPFVRGAPSLCTWTKGTVFAAKDRQKQCLLKFAKGHQNSASNGTLFQYHLFFSVITNLYHWLGQDSLLLCLFQWILTFHSMSPSCSYAYSTSWEIVLLTREACHIYLSSQLNWFGKFYQSNVQIKCLWSWK